MYVILRHCLFVAGLYYFHCPRPFGGRFVLLSLSSVGMATGWVRAGFSIPEPDLRVCLYDPNFARLINGLFFSPQTRLVRSCRASWAPSHHSCPKIRYTNYKCTNLRFIIFRPKIPYTNTNKNHKHNFHIYNFPFQNYTNPNISTIIEIINTNTNSHG